MSTSIKIRRGPGVPTTSALSTYEPGFSTDNDNLYINNGSSIVRIGNKTFNGSAAPDSSLGQDGDFYTQTTTSGTVTTSTNFLQRVDGEWISVGGGGGGGGGAGYFTLSSTLLSGATTMSFSDPRIEASSRAFPWASVWGIVPSSVAVTSGNVVLTFAAQSADIGIEVDISSAQPYAYAEGESF